MLVISSSDLLNEFTVYANQTNDKDETIIVQRSNGKNVVLMSLDKFNEMKKEIYIAREGKVDTK